MCKKMKRTLLTWVRFIFLHSSTIVSVAALTHPNLSAHDKLILCKKMKRTQRIFASVYHALIFHKTHPLQEYIYENSCSMILIEVT